MHLGYRQFGSLESKEPREGALTPFRGTLLKYTDPFWSLDGAQRPQKPHTVH